MRAFWPVASISLVLAALYTLAALWVTFNPASGCTVDGQPCASVGAVKLLLAIGGPGVALVVAVLLGARLRRHRPRLALVWVAMPPLALAAMVAWNVLAARA